MQGITVGLWSLLSYRWWRPELPTGYRDMFSLVHKSMHINVWNVWAEKHYIQYENLEFLVPNNYLKGCTLFLLFNLQVILISIRLCFGVFGFVSPSPNSSPYCFASSVILQFIFQWESKDSQAQAINELDRNNMTDIDALFTERNLRE